MSKLSLIQVKKALRKANPARQYGHNAPERFRLKAGELIEMMAMYMEVKMPLPPNSGKGCRVQPHHIDAFFSDIQSAMYRLIITANNGDEEE